MGESIVMFDRLVGDLCNFAEDLSWKWWNLPFGLDISFVFPILPLRWLRCYQCEKYSGWRLGFTRWPYGNWTLHLGPVEFDGNEK